MVKCMIEAIILAWFLSLFGFQVLFSEGVNELFHLTLGMGSYYVIFMIGGLVTGLIRGSYIKNLTI
ncbi:hypothetical protein ABHN03_04005 [Paenibacillus sp. NRS-1775]|uniref:hypothetical protein n=1 Tax=unclassified Paenibacillus TaxID=185978 RepID=UPI003D2E46D6